MAPLATPMMVTLILNDNIDQLIYQATGQINENFPNILYCTI